jgi:hypothetical protein
MEEFKDHVLTSGVRKLVNYILFTHISNRIAWREDVITEFIVMSQNLKVCHSQKEILIL